MSKGSSDGKGKERESEGSMGSLGGEEEEAMCGSGKSESVVERGMCKTKMRIKEEGERVGCRLILGIGSWGVTRGVFRDVWKVLRGNLVRVWKEAFTMILRLK